MKAVSLLNALKKINVTPKVGHNNQQVVEANGRVLSWYIQDDRVICLHCRRANDISDSMTDYHAGYFVHTIKDAIAEVTPAESQAQSLMNRGGK